MNKDNLWKRFLIAGLVFLYLKDLPYFNVLLQGKIVAGLVFVAMIFMLSVKAVWLFKSALALLAIAGILTLANKIGVAELAGEAIYILMVLGLIQKLNDFRRLV